MIAPVAAPEIVTAYGYHGTSEENAVRILADDFRASDNWSDWLGTGIYFWQDAPARAWEWAKSRYGNAAAVVGVVIELPVGDCVDLLDIVWEDRLRAVYESLMARPRKRAPPKQTVTFVPGEAHPLDRRVINYLADLWLEQAGREILAVRAAFLEGRPVFPGSALYSRAHVQIAVRDPDLVIRKRFILAASSL